MQSRQNDTVDTNQHDGGYGDFPNYEVGFFSRVNFTIVILSRCKLLQRPTQVLFMNSINKNPKLCWNKASLKVLNF